tara:strand:- start:10915 stop:11313 length:399 start_codon:yes stop_codon:yes gene_type:complete
MNKVRDLMIKTDKFPVVNQNTMLKEAISIMQELNLGFICIVDDQKKLKAVFSDGDIRRKLLNVQKPLSSFFIDDIILHSTSNPITCIEDEDIIVVISKMCSKKIWDIPVIDNDGFLVGLVHLHHAINSLIKI